MSYPPQHATARAQRRSAPSARDRARRPADGDVASADEWRRLRRFLILGSDGPAYRAGEAALGRERAAVVERCLRADGPRVVAEIVAVRRSGRAPRVAPALFALAIASSCGDLETRRAALEALPVVARTSAELFAFVADVGGLRGWRRSLRRAVGRWYAARPLETLARETIEHRRREGLGHRDVLRLAFPAGRASAETLERGASNGHGRLFEWIVRGGPPPARPRIVEGFARVQALAGADRAAALVREYGLPVEALRPDQLGCAEVWSALLEEMPIASVIGQLATMTRAGLLTADSAASERVVRRLGEAGELRDAGVDPIAILAALRGYGSGHGGAGGRWEPVAEIVDALDGAFHASFAHVEPTGRRILVALDVSSSMAIGGVAGVAALSPRDASAAMALVSAATEPHCEIVGFHAGERRRTARVRGRARGPRPPDGLAPLAFSPRGRLDEALATVSRLPFCDTDHALPIRYAQQHGRPIDAFVVYTDAETWAGETHPAQALAEYRRRSGIDARLVVVAMTARRFRVADPADPRMLDVVGFDLATPRVITEFVRGEL